MSAARFNCGRPRARAPLSLLAVLGTLAGGAGLAAAQTNVRMLQSLSVSPSSMHVSPVVKINGDQLVAAYPAPEGLNLATLDCTGVRVRTLYPGMTMGVDLKIDSLGQFNFAHRTTDWPEIGFTLDSIQFASPATVRVTGSANMSPYAVALALDSVDRPYIAAAQQHIVVSRFNIQSGSWSTQALTTMPRAWNSPRTPLAIGCDELDRPVVAYLDWNRNIVVLVEEGSGWLRRSTSGALYEDTGIALAFDAGGAVLVAASSEGSLKLLRVTDFGIITQTVDSPSTHYLLGPNGMAVDSAGVIRIVGYQNSGARQLRLATGDGSGWTFTDLASVTLLNTYGAPSIALDAQDRWAIGYYDGFGRAVLVAGTAVPSAITGTRSLAPGRWSECSVPGGPLAPGAARHAASWAQDALATAWDLTGLVLDGFEVIEHSVDGEGNGQVTYRVTYAANAPAVLNLYGPDCGATRAINILSYEQTVMVPLVAGVAQWPDASFTFAGTGQFAAYPQYSVQFAGHGAYEGTGPELPEGYPGGTCSVGAVWDRAWGSITEFSLSVRDCASDDDLDTVLNCTDNCGSAFNPDQVDLDGDGAGDACDADRDADGILEDGDGSGVAGDHACSGGNASGCDDNCSGIANADQLDADGDHVGDACDACAGTVPASPVDVEGCPPPIPGDFERDGDVDADDYAVFIACVTGPDVPGPLGECTPAQFEAADADADGDVDQDDFGAWQRCYSGPNVPGRPACRE